MLDLLPWFLLAWLAIGIGVVIFVGWAIDESLLDVYDPRTAKGILVIAVITWFWPVPLVLYLWGRKQRIADRVAKYLSQ